MSPDATFLAVLAGGALLSIIGWARRRYRSDQRRRRAARKTWQSTGPQVGLTKLHADPNSGIYAIHPSCGYGFWQLYAPGSYDLDAPFPTEQFEPIAQLPDDDPDLPSYDPICEGPGIESPTLEEKRPWITAWVEEVTGRRVVDLAHGWSAPYGHDRRGHEYTIFIETTGSTDAALR